MLNSIAKSAKFSKYSLDRAFFGWYSANTMKTPQSSFPELAKALGVPELWLKREDLHHFGSHKGRSIPFMIDHYWHKEDLRNFVISSSGNAALAAALHVRHHNTNNPDKKITLRIFVGNKIPAEKLGKLTELTDEHIVIEQVVNPRQTAFQLDASGTAKLLRQSTDDLALKGYQELAEELNNIPNLQAIFIPTSSGTTAQALGELFQELEQKPQIHIVQTQAVHPIADSFQIANQTTTDSETSLAGAIVDKIANRKLAVVDAVLKSNGSGWIVSDDQIRAAISLVKVKTSIDISPNSALSVAGLKEALLHGKKFSGTTVCLITGA